jgi:hypothetical protein
MEPGTLEKKIAKLPADLKLKVEGYVDALLSFDIQIPLAAEPGTIYQTSRTTKPVFGSGKGIFGDMAEYFDAPIDEKPKLKREFGSLKGFVTYMADDFDAPLEDFKDYM